MTNIKFSITNYKKKDKELEDRRRRTEDCKRYQEIRLSGYQEIRIFLIRWDLEDERQRTED